MTKHDARFGGFVTKDSLSKEQGAGLHQWQKRIIMEKNALKTAAKSPDTSNRSGRSESGNGVGRRPDPAGRVHDQLLDETKSAVLSVVDSRTEARTAAIAAIRQLEASLVEALQGQDLRGLKNLGLGNVPIYAARIRSAPDSKIAWSNEPDFTVDTLCLLTSGRLVMVQCATDEDGACLDPIYQPATDDDLKAEDVEALSRTLAIVLPRHVQAAQRTRERYAKIQELSTRVERILATP